MIRKLVLVAVALSLAGCASRAGPVEPVTESASGPSPTYASAPSSPTYADPNEQQFVDDATARGLLPRYGSGNTALEFGHEICKALAKNLSTGYLAQEISKAGTMPYTAVEQFAYAAKRNLCPQFRGD